MFGGKKLPEMMRGLGQGVREFKKGVNDIKPENDPENSESTDNPENPNDGEEEE